MFIAEVNGDVTEKVADRPQAPVGVPQLILTSYVATDPSYILQA